MHGDICKIDDLKKATEDVESVVLLAGLVGDPITKKYPEESKFINYDGIQKTISYISNTNHIKKFIFVSTCSNYGVLKDNIKATEDTPLNPVSDYSAAKVMAENLILKNHDTSKKNYILRFATAFGFSNRMRFDLTINEFTRELYLYKKLKIFDQNSWRPYCHTDDFAKIIYRLLETNSLNGSLRTYNIGSNMNNATKKNIVDLLSNKFKNLNLEFLEKGVDIRNYMVSFNKLKNDFPNISFKSIEEGIDEIIFYLNKSYFDDFDNNKKFYGNYSIRYPI